MMAQSIHSNRTEESRCVDGFFDLLTGVATNTSPELVRFALATMGLLELPSIQGHLGDLLSNPRPLAPAFGNSSRCLKGNPGVAAMACVIPFDALETLAREHPDLFEYLIHEFVVLEAVSTAMHDDLMLHFEVTDVLAERLALIDSNKDTPLQEFLKHKKDGVVFQLEFLGNLLAVEGGIGEPKSQAFRRALQLNILEAVKLDAVYGSNANARVGIALAANTRFGPYLEDEKLKWPLGREWIEDYIAWNLAFSIQLKKSPTKLIMPSIACSPTNSEKGEDFVHLRIVSLALSFLDNLRSLPSVYDLDVSTLPFTKPTQDQIRNILASHRALIGSPDDETYQTKPYLTVLFGGPVLDATKIRNPSSDVIERTLYELCDETCHIDQWSASASIPYFSGLGNTDFEVFTTFVVWFTAILGGIGGEVMMWLYMLAGNTVWQKRRQEQWHLVQCVFPIFLLTSLGLAFFRNFLALPFLVLGLWKFGFPETLSFMLASLYMEESCRIRRIADWLDGMGTFIHHSAAALVISALLTGLLPGDRYVLESPLLLVMQHWFVMLRYSCNSVYIAAELLLEGWFEWIIFSRFEKLVYEYHWVAPLTAGVMIAAHWMFLIAGGLGLVFGKGPSRDAPVEDTVDSIRKSSRMLGECDVARNNEKRVSWFYEKEADQDTQDLGNSADLEVELAVDPSSTTRTDHLYTDSFITKI